MIALIDYDAGNVASVLNALHRLGAEAHVTSDTAVLDGADFVIFPGVGHAAPAMARLKERGLDLWLKNTAKPVLGICLGMQLLFDQTEEGNTECLGIIPGRLQKFDSSLVKTPHMGWNTSTIARIDPLFPAVDEVSSFYYVHSFYAPVTRHTSAICTYQTPFSAAVRMGSICGVQFHPEKSSQAGSLLLQRFLSSGVL